MENEHFTGYSFRREALGLKGLKKKRSLLRNVWFDCYRMFNPFLLNFKQQLKYQNSFKICVNSISLSFGVMTERVDSRDRTRLSIPIYCELTLFSLQGFRVFGVTLLAVRLISSHLVYNTHRQYCIDSFDRQRFDTVSQEVELPRAQWDSSFEQESLQCQQCVPFAVMIAMIR